MQKIKTLILLLALCICLPLAACGNMDENMTTTQSIESTTSAENGEAKQNYNGTINGGSMGNDNGYGSYYIYTPNSDRSGLIRDSVEYTKDYAEDLGGMVRESLSELFSRNENDYLPLASKESNIKSISLDQNGTLLIDFDASFAQTINDMEMPDNAAIYALVNTLAQYSTIKSVMFTVDGKPITIDDVTYSAPFMEDPNMVID